MSTRPEIRVPGELAGVKNRYFESIPRILAFRPSAAAVPSNREPVLLVYPARQEPAVHHQDLPGHKRRSIACQEDRRPNQFLRLAETSHRRSHPQFLAALALVQKFRVQSRAENSRRNRIHGNTL